MNKLRVLHLTSGEDRHGGKVSVMNILRESAPLMQIELAVLAEGDLTHAAEEEGFKVVKFLQKKRFDFTVIFKILSYIRNNPVDVVHCHGPRANLFGVFLKPFLKMPVITTIHSDFMLDDFTMGKMFTILFRMMNSMSIRRLDSYICVSAEMRKKLIERGYPLDKTHVAYNGISFEKVESVPREVLFDKYQLPYDPQATYVGILGRLAPVKDHMTFLRGAKRAIERDSGLRFLIGGDGEEEHRMKAFIAEHQLEHHVFMMGHLSEPSDFFQMIDINALTSLHEGGVSYALMEGAVYSKPALATATGGLKEIVIEGVTGRLIPVGDDEAFAKALIEMCDHKIYLTYGQQMENYAKTHFSRSQMGINYLEIYERILTEKQKVFIIGYYGRFNLGDEAILDMTVKFIREISPRSSIKALSYQKHLTRLRSDVEAVSRNRIWSIMAALFSADVLVLGGGTLLQTASSKRSLWYYLSFVWMSKTLLKKKVMMLGNGFGPINGSISRKVTAKLLSMLDLILLRDEGSRAYMEKLGVVNPQIHVTTDFVYALDGKDEPLSVRENRVGVNVRKWSNAQTVYYDLAHTLDTLIDAGKEIIFVPFEDEDMHAIELVKQQMKHNSVTLPFEPNYREVIRHIGGFEALISMRLHGMIFASLSHTPFVGIAYDPKIHYLCEQMDYPYVMDLASFDGEMTMSYLKQCQDASALAKLERYVVVQKAQIEESKHVMKHFL